MALEAEDDHDDTDPLYTNAIKIVRQYGRPSISLVQRHLRIGYNRAARLLEAMETAGLVSAMQSNGSRELHA
ncbi:DNA translocase FtsK [Achromobacter seleniivolatilans]|uniref:DNA translocase FtsK n=1 Tax=Achromobacter seleniivolatilans TaxID=3047478 RepID=A0ABY9M9M2_9BURK|nr:DNA translocase FtsK [Achromobacter sp. R39]WMD23721.1 DNA translocase FtsK [Achromobacter sp. R39]